MSAFAGTVQVSQVDPDARSSTTFWSKIIARVRNWRSHVRAGRQIGALSDRQLRDIGMTRLQTDQHAMQPFRPLIQYGQQDLLLARRWK
jgi:uncharacterized protein YjiS (DUF1127 family)